MWKKALITFVILVVVLVAGFAGFVQASYDKNFDEEYPVPDLVVSIDEDKVERGRYLVHGPAHCSHCHVPFEQMDRVEAGEELPLIGGFGLEIPPGKFYAPNITPDPETGIGNLTDGQIYRMLRHNLNHRGEACFDFMPFVNMSEEDIHAIIAYLRVQEPVRHEQPPVELTFLGKMVHALGAVKPGEPDGEVLVSVKKEPTAAYGKYLAYAVANCRGCHTDRDMKTGEYIGDFYAGGMVFGPDNMTAGHIYTTPNLTPDPETGIMADWDLNTFIARMQKGRLHATSPMPWGAMAQMDSIDLTAIYRFLMSLPPVHNDVGEVVQLPEVAAN